MPPLPSASSLSASTKGARKSLRAETEGGFILNWASSEDFMFFFFLERGHMGKSSCFGTEEGTELLQFLEKSAGSTASSPAFHPGGVWGPPPWLPSPLGVLFQGGRRPEQRARGRLLAVTLMGRLVWVGSRSCRTRSLTRLRLADYQLITRREINFSAQLLAAQVPRAARWREEGA